VKGAATITFKATAPAVIPRSLATWMAKISDYLAKDESTMPLNTE
jgi:hypothetical protein